MTTNHLSRLDPALIRPGRVDLKEIIEDATPHQASELFKRFYGGTDGLPPAELETLRSTLEEKVMNARKESLNVSMAALQGHFIRNEGAEAVAGFDELARTQKEDEMARVKFASSP